MAFGDSTFGSDSSVGRRGRGAAHNRGGSPGRGGGGGGSGNNNNNRRRRRPGGGGPVPNPFDNTGAIPLPGGAQAGGPGSIFDDEAAQGSSGSLDNYRGAAQGLLNQGGIAQGSPVFGAAGSDWLDAYVDDLYGDWTGLENVAGADRPDWHDFFRDQVGGGMTVPEDAGLDWYQSEWGPAAQANLTRLFQSQTPRNRQYDSRTYGGPRRVVAFALTLISSGALIAELASRVLGA